MNEGAKQETIFLLHFFIPKSTRITPSPFSPVFAHTVAQGQQQDQPRSSNLLFGSKFDDSSWKQHLFSQATIMSFCNFPCFECVGRRSTSQARGLTIITFLAHSEHGLFQFLANTSPQPVLVASLPAHLPKAKYLSKNKSSPL